MVFSKRKLSSICDSSLCLAVLVVGCSPDEADTGGRWTCRRCSPAAGRVVCRNRGKDSMSSLVSNSDASSGEGNTTVSGTWILAVVVIAILPPASVASGTGGGVGSCWSC